METIYTLPKQAEIARMTGIRAIDINQYLMGKKRPNKEKTERISAAGLPLDPFMLGDPFTIERARKKRERREARKD